MWRHTYEVAVLPDALERPCLVGPRNETFEENVGPFRESANEAIDRPLWRTSDKTTVGSDRKSKEEENDGLLGEPRDEEDVGPLGESRDEEEDVGPFGESRDDGEIDPSGESSDDEENGPFEQSREEDDGLCQGHREDEEEEYGSPEDMIELMQLAANSMAIVSGALANTGDAPSSNATTAFPTWSQAPLTSSSPPLASTLSTPSRKRARDPEDNTDDEDSPSQQKRMRMDDILGLARNDVNAGRALKEVGVAMIPETQQSRKRARSLEDDSGDDMTKPTRKRLRLHERIKEVHDGEEEYITAVQADVAQNDDSTIVDQDSPSSEMHEVTMVEKAPTDSTEAYKQPSVKEEWSINDEAEESEDASADDEAAPTEIEWDTAHGINSHCANIRITGMTIYDVTGVGRHLYLPTSTGLPDRPWTEEEKEDLRVYIQDYGIEDWALLSQSTNRPEEELQWWYFETVTSRNILAGRPELAGIPDAYPDLAPPPPAPTPEEPRKLRHPDQIGKIKKYNFGDLAYDLKATSFPKITKYGDIVDSKGNVLHGIMGDISHVTKGRRKKPKQELPESLPPAEHFNNAGLSRAVEEDIGSEIKEGEIAEEEISDQHVPAPCPCERGPVSPKKGTLNVIKNGRISKSSSRRGVDRKAGHQAIHIVDTEEGHSIERERPRDHAPSPEPIDKNKGSLNASVEEEEDPEGKREDPDQEQQLPIPKVPKAKTTSAKGPLGPKFTGVSKLCGSSRRGVPRNAAGLRKWSPE